MSSASIRNECPPTCPKVKRDIRAAIEKDPWLLDEIFPRKINDAYPRPSPDVIVSDVAYKRPIDYEKIEEISVKAIEDVVEVRPIEEETVVEVRPIEEETVVEETKVVKKPVIPTERIAYKRPIDYEKIEEISVKAIEDVIEVRPIEEETVVEETKIVEERVIPTERIADRDDEEIDVVEEDIPIVQEQAVIPAERIADHDDEKDDLVEEEKLVQEIAMERAVDEEKVDLVKKEELVTETAVREIPVEKAKVIEDEIERVEPEEYFEPEKPIAEYDEDEEEGITDYEKFIGEELQESLPAVIAREIPEEPRAMRPGISRNAVYEKIDRDRFVRPSREPEERREEVSEKVKRKPVTADVCDETCPLVKEQKERLMRKLKERQRVVDHYYLTKGFSYFEDVCRCSLTCMVNTLSRDPFLKSIFASLALFAIGLKLCSELDAWEMPNRVL